MNALHWLTVVALFTAVIWIPYVLERIVAGGLWPALDNPTPDASPAHAWARRTQAAHANAVENLVLFGAVVLAAAGLGLAEHATVVLACQVYLAARVTHAVVYIAGIPGLRTIAFFTGWLSILAIGYTALTA